jgi:hypothetical protein
MRVMMVLAKSLIVNRQKMVQRGISERHLRVRKARELSEELLDWESGLCEGLQQGLEVKVSFSILQ